MKQRYVQRTHKLLKILVSCKWGCVASVTGRDVPIGSSGVQEIPYSLRVRRRLTLRKPVSVCFS